MGMPEWALEIPSAPVHQEQSNQLVRPFTAQQLIEFGRELIEQFIKRVVLAVAGFFIPGVPSYEQLEEWANNLPGQIVEFIDNIAGINLASWDDFVASLADGKGIDLPLLKAGLDFLSAIFGGLNWDSLPTPAEAWQLVADTFLGGIFSIPDDVQASINESLGHLQDALNGSYTGSGPIFLAVQELAEAWLTVTSPLNLGNAFGKLLPRNVSGVGLSSLTTAVENLIENFITADSVPNVDGWSFDSTIGVPGSAKVVADGTTKTLYSPDLIQVDGPVDTSMTVQYAGVSSGAGQTIKYVLELFADADGLVPFSTPTQVWGVSNPSGTAGPVVLGDSEWSPPSGVVSVFPSIVVDGAVTAGAINFHTPEFFKVLDPALQGGLPKAIQDRIDDLQATWDKFKGGVGGTVNDIEGALNNAGQAIRDALANALGHAGSGHTTANLLTYFQSIPQTVVSGLTGSLGNLQTTLNQIGEIFDNTVVTPINDVVQTIKDWWNQWFGGGSSNAIPLSQKGAANGVAPLGSDAKIPSIYLPASAGGGGTPAEHVLFTLASDQSVPSGVATALTGWQQIGSVQATFDDGTNTRWALPLQGWWDIQSQVVWGSSTTGKRQSAIVRVTSSGSVVSAVDGESADNFPSWGVRNEIRSVQEVYERSPLDVSDTFSVEAFQNSGGALNAVAGYPNGTYVLAVYLGEREFEFVPFSEENTDRLNQLVPEGASGCWVTLGGAGGGGGGGRSGSAPGGGGGGGGGAKIFRTWIPVESLGSTYSITRGLAGGGGARGASSSNGSAGSSGGASTFTSGSTSLSAGGGAPGAGGTASGGSAGAGGTVSASGVTATTAPGAAGGAGAIVGSGGAGVNNTAGAGGGGGGGGGGGQSGGKGGDSTAASGGTGNGANKTGDNPAPGGGGATNGTNNGARGGTGCGAGGGGGGVGSGTTGGSGGGGGNGYTLIEWE